MEISFFLSFFFFFFFFLKKKLNINLFLIIHILYNNLKVIYTLYIKISNNYFNNKSFPFIYVYINLKSKIQISGLIS